MKSLLCFSICSVAITMHCSSIQAQEITDENKLIEKITINGEMIKKSVYQTANSAEVLDKDILKTRAGLDTLRDVLDSATNISVVTGTGKAPTVRGVDGTGAAENANAFFAGSRSRLSWQIDNRPASYNEVVFGDLGIFDLERIEVFKGAQSTLVGRNAIAGTVIVNTKDPTFTTEGLVQIAGGNNQQRRASIMINTPINTDQVALRLSGDVYKRNSTVNYTSYEGIDDPSEIEALSLRSKLLFVPNFAPTSKLLLTLSHTDYTAPNSEIVVYPFKERISNFPQQPVHNPKTTSIAFDFDTEISDTMQFNLNASATDFAFKRHTTPNSSNATIDTVEFVIEPRLYYNNDSGLSTVAGLYFYDADQDEFIEFIAEQNFKDKSETIAAYYEGTMPLTSQFNLSFGIRYEREHHQRNGGDETGSLASIFSDETYHALLPKLGINWQQTDTVSWGTQISRGYNAGGGGITFAFPIVNYEYDPEYVWTSEFYGRQEFLDGRLFLTQNIFFSDYEDMQLPFDLTPEDSSDESFVIRNADRVVTNGIELGATYKITDSLNSFMNIGLLNTDINDYPDSGIEGNNLLTAPNTTATLGLSWVKNNLSTSFVTRYTSDYYTDINNRPGGKTDSYITADVKASYNFKHIRLYASIKNIADVETPIARYPGSAEDNSDDTAVLTQPRSFSIGFEASF